MGFFIVACENGRTLEVEQVLADLVKKDPKWIAIVGDDCILLENICDEMIVGDGTGPARDIVTTSHPEESAEEVTAWLRLSHPGEEIVIVKA